MLKTFLISVEKQQTESLEFIPKTLHKQKKMKKQIVKNNMKIKSNIKTKILV